MRHLQGLAAGPSSGLPLASANADGQSGILVHLALHP